MIATALARLVASLLLFVQVANGAGRSNIKSNAQILNSGTSGKQGHQVRKAQQNVFGVVKLKRSEVDAMERASFLQKLREVRAAVSKDRNNDGDETSLLEIHTNVNEVPLQEQVLNDKRLATYFGEITLGKTQMFKMLFDTGSCEFWVPGPNCKDFTDPERCDKHSLFHPNKSSTYKPFPNEMKLTISYLSGKVQGYLGYDVVSLGPLKVTSQPFGAADQIDVPLLDDVDWDGIIGLAYPNPRLSTSGVIPLFDTIMARKLLKNNIFSYYIGNKGGAVTFGGVDTKYFASKHGANSNPLASFVFAKVTDKGYWTILIEDIELQYGTAPPTSTGVCKTKPGKRCKAIVDTGTYLIYGPAADVKGTLGTIAINSCDDLVKLPTVIYVLHAGEGNKPARVHLKPEDYSLEFKIAKDSSAASTLDCGLPANAAQCKRDCVVGIAPDGSDPDWTLGQGGKKKKTSHMTFSHKTRYQKKHPDWTLGQVFLKSIYTVFDRDLDRIGFARANPDAQVN